MEAPDLSAIVLCYRAGESIGQVIEPLHRQLEDAGCTYELVLVANYWPDQLDDTPQIVERFAKEHPRSRTVIEEKQGAMGWDMRKGLEAAHGEYLILLDGDAQNPVEDVVKMYKRMKATGAEVMKGRRIARFDGPYRRAVSTIYNVLFRLLFRTRGLWDINGKPKGITRRAYQQIQLRSDDWFADAEIVLAARRAGIEVAEMPVIFHRNDERASFVRPSAIWEFLVNMSRAWLRPKRPR